VICLRCCSAGPLTLVDQPCHSKYVGVLFRTDIISGHHDAHWLTQGHLNWWCRAESMISLEIFPHYSTSFFVRFFLDFLLNSFLMFRLNMLHFCASSWMPSSAGTLRKTHVHILMRPRRTKHSKDSRWISETMFQVQENFSITKYFVFEVDSSRRLDAHWLTQGHLNGRCRVNDQLGNLSCR
jgi:hypothetical protein